MQSWRWHRRENGVTVSMSSDEHNEITEMHLRVGFMALFATALVHSIFNVPYALLRLLQYWTAEPSHRLHPNELIMLLSEIMSNCLRILALVNFFFGSQLLPYPFFRYLTGLGGSWMLVSVISISFCLRHLYLVVCGPSASQQHQSINSHFNFWIFIPISIAILDALSALTSFFIENIPIPTVPVLIFYVLLLAPMSTCFAYYGHCIVRALSQPEMQFSRNAKLSHQLHVARRIQLGGCVNVVILSILIIHLAFRHLDYATQFVCMIAFITFSFNVLGTFMISSLHTPPSR